MKKALRRKVELDPKLQAGAMGKIEMKSKNKSTRDLSGSSMGSSWATRTG